MKMYGQDFTKGLSASVWEVGESNHNNVEKSNSRGQVLSWIQ